MNIAIHPTNRMPRVQCENNAPLPPTYVANQSSTDCWRASDFVDYEQQMVKQRLEAKQEKLYNFKQSIKTRVRENEAAKRRGILDKENAVEKSIRSRTKQYTLATGVRPSSAEFGPIPTTPLVGRRGKDFENVNINEIEIEQQADVQIVEFVDDGIANLEIANLEIQETVHYQVGRDVVDPTRLYAGVRAAAMSDERERVRRSVQAKRDYERRMQLEAMERERRAMEAREREERLRQEEEERLFLQEQEEQRLRAIADAARRAELRAKAKEAETICIYAEALHQQFKERIANKNVNIVPLCPCSSHPLDHNPSFCFLNCVYYNNPQAYRAALNNLLEELEIEPVSL